jgi:hypothetical protein
MSKNMNFKNWFQEANLQNRSFWIDFLLDKTKPIDKKQEISQSSTLDSVKISTLINALNSLGEFKKFDKYTQEEVLSKINSKKGTIGELANLLIDI